MRRNIPPFAIPSIATWYLYTFEKILRVRPHLNKHVYKPVLCRFWLWVWFGVKFWSLSASLFRCATCARIENGSMFRLYYDDNLVLLRHSHFRWYVLTDTFQLVSFIMMTWVYFLFLFIYVYRYKKLCVSCHSYFLSRRKLPTLYT